VPRVAGGVGRYRAHVQPTLTSRSEGDRDVPLLVWRLPGPHLAISSGPLGGGIGARGWVLNATVPMSYDRNDPDVHLLELADGLGLHGPGVGLMTGVDVGEVVAATDGGVEAWATVGLSTPTWAAALEDGPAAVGTINIVVRVPARLSEAALVNAVATVTEAKVQALFELGVAATGTPTDAICVVCRPAGPVTAYGGPRSSWGARIARAVHRVVLGGGTADRIPWSERPVR
jgi:adenosylcobinamide hydrolase